MCDFTPDIPKVQAPPPPPDTGPKLSQDLDPLRDVLRGQTLTVKRPRGNALKIQRESTGVNLPPV